jgi:hypothetical protein
MIQFEDNDVIMKVDPERTSATFAFDDTVLKPRDPQFIAQDLRSLSVWLAMSRPLPIYLEATLAMKEKPFAKHPRRMERRAALNLATDGCDKKNFKPAASKVGVLVRGPQCSSRECQTWKRVQGAVSGFILHVCVEV